MSEPGNASEPGVDPAPYLRIVRGHPTDAELAALIVALRSLEPGPAATPEPPSSGWAAYWRAQRPTLQPGPGVWRHSLRG